jgi:predicted site-specific integrase-resolvase
MKLSQYAKKVGVNYRTAWRWYKSGKIKGYQLETGTIIITEMDESPLPEKTVVYARVSSADGKDNLATQAERLVRYCEANGYQIHAVYKEIGSGINDRRRQLVRMLSDDTITRIVVEHKDRLTRFGFNSMELLLQQRGCQIEVVNLADEGKEDLVEDLVSIIYSFCARLYGQRRAKRKTEAMTRELERDDDASR